ncbi:MAG: sigma-70 family RNA polymerase sigma factor [Acidobacteria bacterium]|nr:sigma-70 family RNA polymerase sigma factor [Acidobacteriota bacterium]
MEDGLSEKVELTADRRLAALMKAAQTGDADAYLQLMREIALRLRGFVFRNRSFLATEDIDDLVQDILLSVHAVRATYDSERPFMPWLFAIARNRLADHARRHARRAAREVNVENPDVTFRDQKANSIAATYGDREALMAAIQNLPPAQRSAIEMLKLREMSLREAAVVSGMSIGALKIATHRAMIALRKMLVRDQ